MNRIKWSGNCSEVSSPQVFGSDERTIVSEIIGVSGDRKDSKYVCWLACLYEVYNLEEKPLCIPAWLSYRSISFRGTQGINDY
jgi:hypothetical protein